MSAIGRLWRRAPAWRLTLAASIAFTALAAMFPPSLPVWHGAAFLSHPAPPPPGPAEGMDGAARWTPQPEPAAPEYGMAAMPPPGAGRSGIIPFAGRKLPLPAGSWQEMVLARSGGAAAEQAMLLARIEDDHLTGLLLAAAPGPLNRADMPLAGSSACFAPDAIAHQIIPTPASEGPAARECWTLAASDMARAAAPEDADSVLRGGLDRLRGMGIAIAERMLALRYLRTDDSGWFTALLLLPERPGEPAAARSRMQDWVRRFVPALHKGFDGTLTAGELTAAMVQDPAHEYPAH